MVKRYKMPLLDDPLEWPRDLRKSGTEVVLASDYDALAARVDDFAAEHVKRGLAYETRIRELEAALAKETGGWDAFYKLRKSVGKDRYPGMTAEVKVGSALSDATQNRAGEHE